MRILSVNAGSATLKFGVFDPASASPLTESTIERELQHAAVLAQQHNPEALAGIRLARQRWPGLPQVAVFETAFHARMPEQTTAYAVPQAWRDAGVRRYGFHGLSHQHVLEAVGGALQRAPEKLRIVSCHLGNGASVCAIDRGRSVDTSMGMTALEGLVMGTRGGDLDPGIPDFVARTFGLRLDDDRNASFGASGAEVAELQASWSPVAVLAVRAREQWLIARETAAVLRDDASARPID